MLYLEKAKQILKETGTDTEDLHVKLDALIVEMLNDVHKTMEVYDKARKSFWYS